MVQIFNMVEQRYSLVLLCNVCLILISTCCSFYIEKAPARVLITEDRSVNDGYIVEIEANGETRQLRLTPMESIWTDDAQSLTISVNEKEEETYEYKSIPQIKVYHDSKFGSVLSLKEGKVNGILDSDYVILSEEEGHFVVKSLKKKSSRVDFRRVPENLPKMSYKRISKDDNGTKIPIPIMMENNERQVQTVTPEVVIIVDSKLASVIGTDTQIYDYLTCFWNAVARRYLTITNIKIKIRLVGSVIIRTSSGEPFITSHLSGEDVWGDDCLTDESKWVYSKLSTLPKHDLIYLQTGRDLLDDDGSDGLGGIAYMGTACLSNGGDKRSYDVGLGEDIGAFYDGIHIATHEVGHILNAPHDADEEDGTQACPWDDGHIMSYIAGNPNHMTFSSCSIANMTWYLSSPAAACVRSNLNQTTPNGVYTSTSLPGDKMTMTDQCKKITGNSRAVPYTDSEITEDHLCYDMFCTYPDPVTSEDWWYTETFQEAPEGCKCITPGKRCFDGKCV